MSIYGDEKVDITALKRWLGKISTDDIETIEIGGKEFVINKDNKKILDLQIEGFKKMIDSMDENDYWGNALVILSPLSENALFKVKNGCIRLANYYECLVTPSNIKTYKKIIKGFDGYIEIGSVDIVDDGKLIAHIGQKSDLIWTIFYEYFINTDYEYGETTHVYSEHEKIMSIQLYDVENKSEQEINRIINEILLKLSFEHDMDFEIIQLDAVYKLEGKAESYTLHFHDTEYEYIPSLYLSNALRSQDARLSYLCYYQVIEYFFVRAQNYYFLTEYSQFSANPFNHNELRKVLKHYKDALNERESLKLVLKRAVCVNDLKAWLSSDASYIKLYCDSGDLKIDLSKDDSKIINALAMRIYSYRCSIAHAKGDMDEFIAIPSLKDEEIEAELPLIRYISHTVLKACSE